MLHNFLRLVATALVVALTGCRDPRPEIPDAKAEFLRRHPTAEMVTIKISEDEVVARSFKVTYRTGLHEPTKTIELQYMKNAQGVWEVRPNPPSELP